MLDKHFFSINPYSVELKRDETGVLGAKAYPGYQAMVRMLDDPAERHVTVLSNGDRVLSLRPEKASLLGILGVMPNLGMFAMRVAGPANMEDADEEGKVRITDPTVMSEPLFGMSVVVGPAPEGGDEGFSAALPPTSDEEYLAAVIGWDEDTFRQKMEETSRRKSLLDVLRGLGDNDNMTEEEKIAATTTPGCDCEYCTNVREHGYDAAQLMGEAKASTIN